MSRLQDQAPEDPLPDVCDRADLARVLKCSERTVQRRKRAGELPPTLFDRGHDRWSRSSILAWLDGAARRRGRR
jgi:hypothetical protein